MFNIYTGCFNKNCEMFQKNNHIGGDIKCTQFPGGLKCFGRVVEGKAKAGYKYLAFAVFIENVHFQPSACI